MKFYATMGQTHVHSIKGITVDKDSLVEIEAVDYEDARAFCFDLFGRQWCMLYDDPDIAFYPRGVVLSLRTPPKPPHHS